MIYNPDMHHRRSMRLKGYDYASNGMYFITICAQNRANLFGEIVGADMESAPTVSGIIQSFKRNTTIQYIAGVKEGVFPAFDKRMWQRNYYEHIIRNESEYIRIREYIDQNPLRWREDRYHEPSL